jgi:hypothetical protein
VARDHVAGLVAAGVSVRRVAGLAGVSWNTVHVVLAGSPAPAGAGRRLLGVTLAAAGTPEGARRRLRALSRLGWPAAVLAAAAGTGERHLRAVCLGAEPVPALIAGARRAYEELRDVDPAGRGVPAAESSVVASEAAGAGWAPPVAWDDDAIDDPAASPAVRGEGRSRLSLAELLEDLAWLAAAGCGFVEAAGRCGYDDPRSLERRLSRAALVPDERVKLLVGQIMGDLRAGDDKPGRLREHRPRDRRRGALAA